MVEDIKHLNSTLKLTSNCTFKENIAKKYGEESIFMEIAPLSLRDTVLSETT